MTLKEARLVASIVETAEDGCGGCVNEAVRELNEKFPAFTWKTIEIPGHMASVDVEERKPRSPAPSYIRQTCR